MNNLPRIDLNEKVPLESAWIHYADLPCTFSEHRRRYYALKFPQKQESAAEYDARQAELERLKRSLQLQFTGHLHAGYFTAFGCFIGEGAPSSEEVEISKALFNTLAPGFEIDFNANHVRAYGKLFVDVEVLPNVAMLMKDYPERTVEAGGSGLQIGLDDKDTGPRLEKPKSPFGRPGGAKSHQSVREQVVLKCYANHEFFDEWTFENKQIECIKTANKMFEWGNWEDRFFGRSSLYETIRTLKSQGKLPSKNVQ